MFAFAWFWPPGSYLEPDESDNLQPHPRHINPKQLGLSSPRLVFIQRTQWTLPISKAERRATPVLEKHIKIHKMGKKRIWDKDDLGNDDLVLTKGVQKMEGHDLNTNPDVSPERRGNSQEYTFRKSEQKLTKESDY